jgi:hypothetical protein
MRASSCAGPPRARSGRRASPSALIRRARARDRASRRALQLRPIRPDDEALLQRFIRHLTPEDIRLRFFGPLRELTHEMAGAPDQIDYDREMAFLLLDGDELLGVGRLAADPGFEQAEFALIVRSDRSAAATARCCCDTCWLRQGARHQARDRPHAAREPQDARAQPSGWASARRRRAATPMTVEKHWQL